MLLPLSNPWLIFDEIKTLPPEEQPHVIQQAAKLCTPSRFFVPSIVTGFTWIMLAVLILPEFGCSRCPITSYGQWDFSNPDWWFAAFALSTGVTVFVGGPALLGLTIRNAIHYRAIKQVLGIDQPTTPPPRECPQCQYSLKGLIPDDQLLVTCPECGTPLTRFIT